MKWKKFGLYFFSIINIILIASILYGVSNELLSHWMDRNYGRILIVGLLGVVSVLNVGYLFWILSRKKIDILTYEQEIDTLLLLTLAITQLGNGALQKLTEGQGNLVDVIFQVFYVGLFIFGIYNSIRLFLQRKRRM